MIGKPRRFGDPKKRKVSEVTRIRNLPRRAPELGAYDLTDRFVNPGSSWELKHVQSWALHEIETMGKLSTPDFGYGCLLPIGVGHGKTFIAYGAPVVLGIEPADTLVLAPAGLRSTFEREGLKYAAECITPPVLPFMSYCELSHPNAAFELRERAPKLIILDEAHHIRDPTTARGKRFYKYLRENPDVIVIAMTGTMLRRSIKDVAPMATQVLGPKSPIPTSYNTLISWALCVDVPRGNEAMPQAEDYRRLAPLVADELDGADIMSMKWSGRKAAARDAFHKRFISTPGVVYTSSSSANNGLIIEPLTMCLPTAITAYMNEVDETWTRPDGVELEDDLRVSEVLRMLSLGYFYRWQWGEAGEDVEWNEARLDYARCVRDFLKRSRPGVDSPALVAMASRLPLDEDFGSGPTVTRKRYPNLVAAYERWQSIKDRANPVPEPVILDRTIIERVVDDFASTLGRKERGLIWYEHEATTLILDGLGIKVYRAGDDPELDPNRPGTVAAASIAAHGTGKQLQAWNRARVINPPANGETFEQMIARHHRPGQEFDDVFVDILVHTPEYKAALRKARLDAEFAQSMQGQGQKLNIATWKPSRRINS